MGVHALALIAVLAGCGGGSTPAPDGAPADGAAPAPAPEAAPAQSDTNTVMAALAVRSTPEPRCQDVDKLVPDPIAAYREIATTVKDPPYVPMRAATCLLSQHPHEAEEDALKWVVDPEQASLTTLVLGRLDTLPLESAKKIATASLAGPHAEIAKMRISRLKNPELKALVSGSP